MPTVTGRAQIDGQPFDVSAAYDLIDPSVMPASALAGWRRVFSDDFSTDVAAGALPAARYGVYNGFADSAKNGQYNKNIVSVAAGKLKLALGLVASVPQCASVTPLLQPPKYSGQVYGRYSMRMWIDPNLTNYAAACLLWSDTNTWADGECDFPEGALTGKIHGFNHTVGNPAQNAQVYLSTTDFASGWHTYTTEWLPGVLRYILDGVVVMEAKTSVPTASMHWGLQFETAYGAVPPAGTAGNVLIDWLTIDALVSSSASIG